ncbi:MAG TPA: hypothetical protein VG056_09885 [Pirellulales bacterium]|nr:hypothetical protein [Pirellulales bacterium]
MNDDIEELLARLKPKGVEAELRPRVLAAVENELTRGKMPACNHPAGHQFVCVHCGGELERASRARRWAWQGSLAAMTSIAATLLVVLWTSRPPQVADREGAPRATSPAGATEPSAPPQVARGTIDDRGFWRRFALSGRPDAREILSAGETELRDDLPAGNGSRTKDNVVSMVDMDSTDVQLQNGALLKRILRESGVSIGEPDRSIFEPSNLHGSRL